MAYKIAIDKEKCIGCGACAAACDNFELVEGKAHAKKEKLQELGCSKEAEDVCPVEAIFVDEL